MKVNVIKHPLIQHKFTLLRDKNTGPKEFRELLTEIGLLMGFEITREVPLGDVEVETPVAKCKAKMISGRKIAIIVILRAGLGMADGLIKLIPLAKIGHIGCYRDPQTLNPIEYYCKLPADIDERNIVLVDPMLATGGSAEAAISLIKAKGGKNIKFMSLVAAPEGIKFINNTHPDVEIFVAQVDDCLNEYGYIVPGLGDAGDRIFGTR